MTRKEKSCGDKRRHRTKQAALDHKADLERKTKTKGLNVYKCEFCPYWHVGHMSHLRSLRRNRGRK